MSDLKRPFFRVNLGPLPQPFDRIRRCGELVEEQHTVVPEGS